MFSHRWHENSCFWQHVFPQPGNWQSLTHMSQNLPVQPQQALRNSSECLALHVLHSMQWCGTARIRTNHRRSSLQVLIPLSFLRCMECIMCQNQTDHATCSVCEKALCEDCSLSCDECEERFCGDCAGSGCDECYNSFCVKCGTKDGICESCKKADQEPVA